MSACSPARPTNGDDVAILQPDGCVGSQPMILGGSSLVRYLRLMCSIGSPNTMLLSPPGGFRTFRLDRC